MLSICLVEDAIIYAVDNYVCIKGKQDESEFNQNWFYFHVNILMAKYQ